MIKAWTVDYVNGRYSLREVECCVVVPESNREYRDAYLTKEEARVELSRRREERIAVARVAYEREIDAGLAEQNQ